MTMSEGLLFIVFTINLLSECSLLKGRPLQMQCIYTSNTVIAQHNFYKFYFSIVLRIHQELLGEPSASI